MKGIRDIALTTLVLLVLKNLCQACHEDRFVSIDRSFIMKSLAFPNNYPVNSKCEYRYETSPGYRVRVHFTAFTLESGDGYGTCVFDFLRIFDGEDEFAQEFGSFCGIYIPPNIVSTGQHLYAIFHADDSIQAEGFNATVTAVPDNYREPLPTPVPGSCFETLRQSVGAFFSPGYPDSYETYQLCTYIVSLPDASHHILLRFTSFDMEPSYQCVYDYIEVRNGHSSISPLIGRFCGGSGNHPPDLIESSGPEIHVVFHSDVSATFEGFYAEYASSAVGFVTPFGSDGGNEELKENHVSVCDISQALQTDGGGIIVSHQSYPDGTYGSGVTCSMVFVGSQINEKIFINVVDMDIPQRQSCGGTTGDSLRIFDGDLSVPNTAVDQTNLATLCGTDTGQYSSSGLYAVVQFTTNETPDPGYRGFKLVYSIYYEDSYGCLGDDFHCNNYHCIKEFLVCDGYDHCADNSDETMGCKSKKDVNGFWGVTILIVFGVCVLILGASLAFLVMKNVKTPSRQSRDLDTNALTTVSGTAANNSASMDFQPSVHTNPTYGTSTVSAPPAASATCIDPEVQPPSYSQIFYDPAHPPNSPSVPAENKLYPKQEYSMFLASGLAVQPTAPPVAPIPQHDDADNNDMSFSTANDPLPAIPSTQSRTRLPPLTAPLRGIQRGNTLPGLPPIKGIRAPKAKPPNNNP